MQLVVTVFFYAHTALCLACAAFTLARATAYAPDGLSALLDWRDLDSVDDLVMQMAGWTILALYLAFTEVYLYRMQLGL